MRKKVIAGNWKMNMNLHQSQKLVSEIINGLGKHNKAEVILCPPFTSLNEINFLLKGITVKLGAKACARCREFGAANVEVIY